VELSGAGVRELQRTMNRSVRGFLKGRLHQFAINRTGVLKGKPGAVDGFTA
jgi:hypothetical protein